MLAAARARFARDQGLPWLLAALVLVVLLYAPTLARGLTNYDDPWLYRDNTVVQHASWASVATIFTDFAPAQRYGLGAEYLPVRDLSVLLDYAVFGDWYPGFHATSLAIYLGALALWYAALGAFGIDRRIVGIAILVWAIHPSHAESVAWLAERKGVLAALFAGAAALGYARWRGGGRAWHLVLAAVAAVCAVWSKAPAAFALAALVPLEVLLSGRVSWRRSLVGLGVIGAVAAAAFAPVVLVARAGTVVGSGPETPASGAGLVLGVHGFYVQLVAMLPRNAVAYPITSEGPTAFDIALGALALAAVLAVALVPRRGRWAPSPPVRVAAWLWLLGWLPIGHALLPLQNTAADRYLLWPSLGFALGFACLAVALPARARRLLVGAVVVAAGLRTYDAQAQWSSPLALWERAVASDPSDTRAWSHYAEALDDAGDRDRALAAVTEGERVAPGAALLLREALLRRELGDADGAFAAMFAAAAGGEPIAMSDLALLELNAGELADALTWARRGARESPYRAQAHRAHGQVALAAHANPEALEAFEQAYALEPGYLGNRYNLALALIAMGQGAAARPHLEACLSDPSLESRARAELAKL